jgi:hypothetical protein
MDVALESFDELAASTSFSRSAGCSSSSSGGSVPPAERLLPQLMPQNPVPLTSTNSIPTKHRGTGCHSSTPSTPAAAGPASASAVTVAAAAAGLKQIMHHWGGQLVAAAAKQQVKPVLAAAHTFTEAPSNMVQAAVVAAAGRQGIEAGALQVVQQLLLELRQLREQLRQQKELSQQANRCAAYHQQARCHGVSDQSTTCCIEQVAQALHACGADQLLRHGPLVSGLRLCADVACVRCGCRVHMERLDAMRVLTQELQMHRGPQALVGPQPSSAPECSAGAEPYSLGPGLDVTSQ